MGGIFCNKGKERVRKKKETVCMCVCVCVHKFNACTHESVHVCICKIFQEPVAAWWHSSGEEFVVAYSSGCIKPFKFYETQSGIFLEKFQEGEPFWYNGM